MGSASPLPFVVVLVNRETHESVKMPDRKRWWRYGPLVLWILLISLASTGEFSAANTSRFIRPVILWLFPHTTRATLLTINFLTRKAAHVCEYAVLGFLTARPFSTSSRRFLSGHWFLLSLLLVAIYALLDEFHQSFVPSRTGSIYDSLIDVFGGLLALTLYRRLRKA